MELNFWRAVSEGVAQGFYTAIDLEEGALWIESILSLYRSEGVNQSVAVSRRCRQVRAL